MEENDRNGSKQLHGSVTRSKFSGKVSLDKSIDLVFLRLVIPAKFLESLTVFIDFISGICHELLSYRFVIHRSHVGKQLLKVFVVLASRDSCVRLSRDKISLLIREADVGVCVQ